MAKVCWATRSDPRDRFARLASFFARQGLDGARASLARRRDALDGREARQASCLKALLTAQQQEMA